MATWKKFLAFALMILILGMGVDRLGTSPWASSFEHFNWFAFGVKEFGIMFGLTLILVNSLDKSTIVAYCVIIPVVLLLRHGYTSDPINTDYFIRLSIALLAQTIGFTGGLGILWYRANKTKPEVND
jgi:hypothetical protein